MFITRHCSTHLARPSIEGRANLSVGLTVVITPAISFGLRRSAVTVICKPVPRQQLVNPKMSCLTFTRTYGIINATKYAGACFIQRGGGTGPTKPRQPDCTLGVVMVPSPAEPGWILEDEKRRNEANCLLDRHAVPGQRLFFSLPRNKQHACSNSALHTPVTQPYRTLVEWFDRKETNRGEPPP